MVTNPNLRRCFVVLRASCQHFNVLSLATQLPVAFVIQIQPIDVAHDRMLVVDGVELQRSVTIFDLASARCQADALSELRCSVFRIDRQ